MKKMIITTTPEIPGKKIKEVLGIAKGSTVRSRNFGIDILAMLKNLIGGEIKTYTKMIQSAREESYSRMLEDAKRLKADAVINMRFMTSTIMQGASEMLAYGTAVKFK